jgi:hypothetical protein
MNETQIQNDILCALSANGYLVNRQHVGTFRSLYGNRTINVGQEGMADIAAVVPVTIAADMVGRTIGVYVEVEVKTLKGKQRDGQKLREHAVKKRGAAYIIARSPAEALDKISALYK